MGAYDFMMNAIQSGQISDLVEEIERLNRRVEILEGWIRYYGECKEGKPDKVSSMVETSERLETNILEERAKCSEEGNQK